MKHKITDCTKTWWLWRFFNWIISKQKSHRFTFTLAGDPAKVKEALEKNKLDHASYTNTLDTKPEVVIKATGETKKIVEASPILKKIQRSK
jgi:hypothetical protein